MERFNLNTWLQDKSRKVVTRDRRSVRIICTDANEETPIAALVTVKDMGRDKLATALYTKDGRYGVGNTHYDLFFADEEEELTDFEKTMIQFSHERNSLIQFEHEPAEINVHLSRCSQKLLALARKEIEKENSDSGKQKQEWSKEDEKKLNDTIFFLNEFNEVYHDDAQNCIKWLKSLKDKFQLHPEETEYISKEEHEKILEQVYKEHDEDLEQAYKNADKVQFNRGMDEVLANPQKYFHIGDTIRLKNSTAEYTIVSIFNGRYYGDGWSLGIQEAADHYELVKEQDCDLENTIDLLEAIAEDQEEDYCPYNAATLRKTSSWLKSIKKKQQWTPEDKSMYLRVLGILGKCYMKVLPDKVKEELEWMKGLDKRIELNPKQEWSQEDTKRIQRIHDFIWKNRKGDTDEIFQQEQDANWLMTFVPQPKQELTEEDKEVLNTIISDVTRTYRSCGIGTDEYNIRAKAISFLKSIKDKPKQEWTEKDMVMLTSIINDSEQGALLDPEQINWLKTKIQ